jgi:hypothetical protein
MTDYTLPAPRRSWLGRAEDWLDSKGRGAWIAAMVLGFVAFWPIGLALVAYITWTNRWSGNKMFKMSRCANRGDMARHGMNAMRSSGNSAFDAYKAETLRRLEDEQEAFEAFLQRLREAKDKTEFDAFMDDRAKAARNAPPAAGAAEGSGAY